MYIKAEKEGNKRSKHYTISFYSDTPFTKWIYLLVFSINIVLSIPYFTYKQISQYNPIILNLSLFFLFGHLIDFSSHFPLLSEVSASLFID